MSDGFWAEFDEPRSLQGKFDAWISTAHGCRIALRVVELCRWRDRNGWRRAGVKALIEDVRWNDDYNGRTHLSNDLAPYLARWIMAEFPELAGYFELRPLKR